MASRRRWLLLALCGIVASLVATPAEAHFHLIYPPSWIMENTFGDPQKMPPCGGEGGTPTRIVTTFRPGQTITVQWQETIYHPGHWRIAFAADRGQLMDPMVTVDANQISVSATIENPPVPPVLLDNLFPRTGNGTPMMFSQDVVLPSMTCAHCTLQVIQFMEGHGPPNYIYHHCADIQLINDSMPDGGSVGGQDAGMRTEAGSATDASPEDAASGIDSGRSTGADANGASAGDGDVSTTGASGTGGCSCEAGRPLSPSDMTDPSLILLGLFPLWRIRLGRSRESLVASPEIGAAGELSG